MDRRPKSGRKKMAAGFLILLLVFFCLGAASAAAMPSRGTAKREAEKLSGRAEITLPDDSAILREEPSFFALHPWGSAEILSAILLFLLASAAAICHNRRRRLLLRRLRERDRNLRELMDLLPGGVGIFREDAEGGLTVSYLNEGFYRMMGARRDDRWETVRKDLTAYVHPDDRAGIREELKRSGQTDGPFCSTFRIRNGEGRYEWVTLRANCVRREDGCGTYYGSYSNVNAIKLIQEQLQESKSSLQTAMEHAGLIYWEYDPKRRLAVLGDRAREELGVQGMIENYPDSWLRMDRIEREDLPLLRETFQKINGGAPEALCEIRRKTADGVTHWERLRLTSIYDSVGSRGKVIVTDMDITDQVEAAAEYERQMAQVKAAIPDPVVSFRMNLTRNVYQDGETRFPDLLVTEDQSVDSLFQAMYGRSVTGGERDAFASRFSRKTLLDSFERGETIRTFERRCWVGGRIRWVSVRIYMARHPVTGDVEALIYSFDIDEKKYMEQIVSTVIQNDYLLLLRIDLRNDRIRVFSSGQKVTQTIFCDAEAEIERQIRKKYAGDDPEEFIRKNRFSEIRRQLSKSSEYTLYATCCDSRGRLRRMESVYTWIDRVQQLVCYTLSDITDAFEEEQRRNAELQTALSAAEQANRTKTDFLSRMSHEIRTPMNAILGLARLGLQDCREPAAQECLAKIGESGEYLLGLINDVLDMSRIESGRILLHPGNTDTSDFFASVRTIIEPKMREKRIRFLLDTSGVITRYVVIDKMRMQQIYLNLLNNAVKFSDPGTDVECVVSHRPCGGGRITSTIVIRDHGCGMSEEFQKRMFLPFEQEYNRYSDAQPGTGLGLAIVRNLVDQMGGSISVRSRLDAGTEFTIVLTVPRGQAPAKREAGPVPPKADLNGRRVLLVEDHPTNAEIAKRLLEHRKMEVEHAANGQIAVERFLSHEPGYYDVILMDIRMPVMDGMEAAKTIRAAAGRPDGGKIPIIAMTANAFENDREATKKAGMNAHLAKPIHPSELYDTLRAYIG